MSTTSSIILGSILKQEFMMDPSFSIVYLDPSDTALAISVEPKKGQPVYYTPLLLILVPGNKKATYAGYCRPTNTLYIRFSDEDV